MSSIPEFHEAAFDEPIFYCYNITQRNNSGYHQEKRPFFKRTSKKAVTSSTHKLVADFIRYSHFPLNLSISNASSSKSYYLLSNSDLIRSTSNDYYDLEKRCPIGNISKSINQPSLYPSSKFHIRKIGNQMASPSSSTTSHSIPSGPRALEQQGLSQCSTTVEVGSIKSILEETFASSYAAEPHGLTGRRCQKSSEQIYDVPPNSRASSLERTYEPPPYRSVSTLEHIYEAPPNRSVSTLEHIYEAPPNSVSTLEHIYEAPPNSSVPTLEHIYDAPPKSSASSMEPTYKAPPNSSVSTLEHKYDAPPKSSASPVGPLYDAPPNSSTSSLEQVFDAQPNSITSPSETINNAPPNSNASPSETVYDAPLNSSASPSETINVAPPNSRASPSKTINDAPNSNSSPLQTINDAPSNSNASPSETTYDAPLNSSASPLETINDAPSNSGASPPVTVYDSSSISSSSQTSSEESWDSEDETNSLLNQSFEWLTSSYFLYNKNSTYPESSSEKNGQINSTLIRKHSSGTYSVKRQCPSQLQTTASPPETSTSSSSKYKNVVNAVGRMRQPSPYSDTCDGSKLRGTDNYEATNIFLEENSRNRFNLAKHSLKFLNPKEHVLTKLNLPQTLTSSEEGYSTENTGESAKQSLASLSITYNPQTVDASEMSVPTKKLDSEQNVYKGNKTRKKSKLMSCFTACLRPSSPQQIVKRRK